MQNIKWNKRNKTMQNSVKADYKSTSLAKKSSEKIYRAKSRDSLSFYLKQKAIFVMRLLEGSWKSSVLYGSIKVHRLLTDS